MNQAYEDITRRLGAPLWWDEYSVPRYDAFAPELCNDIYAVQACLLDIACQHCGQRFLVAASWGITDEMRGAGCLSALIAEDSIHWGDPPIHGCAGDTENCDDLAVVQFWTRGRGEWARDGQLERRLGV